VTEEMYMRVWSMIPRASGEALKNSTFIHRIRVPYQTSTGSEVKLGVKMGTVIRNATRTAVGIRILRVRAQSTPLSMVYPGSRDRG